MTNEYRTQEQFIKIAENAINWNWNNAFKWCVEYWFYANDLINHFNEDTYGLEPTDLAILSEWACELRYK